MPSSGSARAARVTAGFQITYVLVGLEIAGVVQSTDGPWRGFFGIEPAVFLSFGYLFVEFNVALPVTTLGSGSAYDVMWGFTVGLKLPIRTDRDRRWYQFW
jgi:hypothetical protein